MNDFTKLAPYAINTDFQDFNVFLKYGELDPNDHTNSSFWIRKRTEEENITSWDELGAVTHIGGSLIINHPSLQTLGSLEQVRGFFRVMPRSKSLTDLGNLSTVSGNVFLEHYVGTSTNNLTHVGGILDIRHCDHLETLGNIEQVGGDLELYNVPKLKSLGKLRKVGGHLNLDDCWGLEDLGELESVGGTIMYDIDNPSLVELFDERGLI